MPAQDAHNKFWYAAYREDGTVVASHGNYQPGMALKGLLSEIYRIHSNEVILKQSYKCHDCGQVKRLQVHHRVPRSKGRNDRVENLIALCQEDHERRHRTGSL